VSLESRADKLKATSPDLVVHLTLYPTEAGGRKSPFPPGLSCLCCADKSAASGWDGCPQLGDEPLYPGQTRRVGFIFLSGQEAAAALSKSAKFYLRENRLIGEAQIVHPPA
jgi:hypothetical protein